MARRRSRIKDFVMTLLLLGAMALGSAWLAKKNEVSLTGSYRIIDGDSLVLNGQEIRLLGIDAPEYRQNCNLENGASYPCGKQSREALVRLAKSGKLTCKGWEEDKYQRLLATCYSDDRNINLLMVEEGWALSFGSYEGSQARAQRDLKGVWQGGFDKPSVWRENERDAHTGGWISRLFGQ